LSSEEEQFFSYSIMNHGSSVATSFPSLSYEIEEAAKCLALERGTASAVHSIRGLEASIRAISRCLGIPDPIKASDRSWGKMLGKVRDEYLK
jgi:hypothetical protein